MRFLIVEDDWIYRTVLEDFLHPHGLVHTAVHGIEAIRMIEHAIAQGKPYDAVFLDIHLPELDGHQVLEFLRDLEHRSGTLLGEGANVVVMSSHGDSSNVLKAFSKSCNHYLIKPYTHQQVYHALGIAG